MNHTARAIFAAAIAIPVVSAQDRELSELAQKLSDQIAAAGRRIVAVVSFTNNQHGPDLSNFLVGRLNVLLIGTGKSFEVVTRSRIREILQERRLKYADAFDEKTFAEIGKLAGADSVVSGEYAAFSNRISLTVQVLDVSSGRIIGGQIVDIPRTADLNSLLTSKPPPGPPSSDGDATPTPMPSSGSGLVRLKPGSASPAGRMVYRGGHDSALAIYHCERHPGILRCVQTITIEKGEAVALNARTYFSCNEAYDSTGEGHKILDGFFLSTTGKKQEGVNLGKGDTAIFVHDYEAASANAATVKIVAPNCYDGPVAPREVRNVKIY